MHHSYFEDYSQIEESTEILKFLWCTFCNISGIQKYFQLWPNTFAGAKIGNQDGNKDDDIFEDEIEDIEKPKLKLSDILNTKFLVYLYR